MIAIGITETIIMTSSFFGDKKDPTQWMLKIN